MKEGETVEETLSRRGRRARRGDASASDPPIFEIGERNELQRLQLSKLVNIRFEKSAVKIFFRNEFKDPKLTPWAALSHRYFTMCGESGQLTVELMAKEVNVPIARSREPVNFDRYVIRDQAALFGIINYFMMVYCAVYGQKLNIWQSFALWQQLRDIEQTMLVSRSENCGTKTTHFAHLWRFCVNRAFVEERESVKEGWEVANREFLTSAGYKALTKQKRQTNTPTRKGGGSASGGRNSSSRVNPKPCWGYNDGKPCLTTPCLFSHKCQNCRKWGHPKTQCSQPPRQQWPMRQGLPQNQAPSTIALNPRK